MNKEIKETFKRSMPIMAVTLAIGFVAMFNMICVVGVKYSSLSITKRAANYLNWMNKFAVIGNSPWFKIVYVILGIAAVVVIYRFFTSFSSDDEPSQNIVERKKKNILGIYLLFITALWGLAIYLVPPAVGHMYEIKLLELFAFSLCAGGFWIFSSAKWLGLPEGKRIDHKWAFLLGAAAVWVVAAEIYVFGKISRPLEIFLTSGVGLFQLDDIMTMVRLLMWGIFVIILHIFIVVPTIFALVPVKLKLEKRFFRILIPATIFLLVFLTSNFLRMYLKKYDYDKKDFAEATGIDINSHTHKTLIYLREDDSGRKESYMEKISLKRKIWDPFTYMTHKKTERENIYDLSSENLKKIQKYSDSHPRTFYWQSVNKALKDGLLMNWEYERATDFSRKMGVEYGDILHLILGASNMRNLPVTKKNIAYLDELADENRFHHGPSGYSSIAMAYKHFGNKEKMEYFKNKGLENKEMKKERRENLEKLTFPKGGVLTEGIITGGIYTKDGLPLPEKAGLFNASYVSCLSTGGKYYPTTFYVASCDIEKNGKFKFSNLGEGEYCLAFMFKGDQTQEGKTIKATPNPGYIKLNKKNAVRNCGRIKIGQVGERKGRKNDF